MTHADLVARASRWLRNTKGCSPVLAEFSNLGPEVPDAIGWRGHRSILVECKVSRSDLRRDRDKPHGRHPELGMGHERWYLTPPGLVRLDGSGLLAPDELPDGWGLAEVGVRSVRVVRKPVARADYHLNREIGLLASACRRHEIGVPYDAATGRFVPLTDPRHPRWAAP